MYKCGFTFVADLISVEVDDLAKLGYAVNSVGTVFVTTTVLEDCMILLRRMPLL